MGLRGPAPKPVELKLLEGNRGHRPLQVDQLFRPEVGMPSAPAYLTKEGRKAWRRLGPELLRYNLLSTIDRDAFSQLCQTIGRVELLERSLTARCRMLEDAGKDASLAFFDKTPNGMVVQSALYLTLKREQESLRAHIESFGLRPDARARVTTAIRAQLQLFENPDAPRPPAPSGAPQGFANFR